MSVKSLVLPTALAFAVVVAAYADGPGPPSKEPACPEGTVQSDCEKPNPSIKDCGSPVAIDLASCEDVEKAACSGVTVSDRKQYPNGTKPAESGLTRTKEEECQRTKSCEWERVPGWFNDKCIVSDWTDWSLGDKIVVWEGCNCPGEEEAPAEEETLP